jgi:hypothetical protein
LIAIVFAAAATATTAATAATAATTATTAATAAIDVEIVSGLGEVRHGVTELCTTKYFFDIDLVSDNENS